MTLDCDKMAALELRKKGGVSTPSGFNDDIERERMHRERFSIVGYSPDFLQPLASPKFFLLLSVLGSILGGSVAAAWFANMTSIERRFQMPFATIGLIQGLSVFGGTLSLFVFAHFGGNGHRPRWLGAANLLFAVAVGMLTSAELWVPAPTLIAAGSSSQVTGNNTMMLRQALSSSGMCVIGDDLPCHLQPNEQSRVGVAVEGGMSTSAVGKKHQGY